MYKITTRPIAMLRAASTGAALAALCIVLPGCVFDSSGVPPRPRFKCNGTINEYARVNPPKPPTTTVYKNGGDPNSKAWVPFDLSKPSNALRFYTDPDKDWRPTSTHPMLKGSFLLQLASADRLDASPADYHPNNFVQLYLVGQDVDRFWIAFDDRATTTPQWLRDSFKKVTPDRFITSSQQIWVKGTYSPWGGEKKPVRYQLWEPKSPVTSFVSWWFRLGGNNAQGVVWKDDEVGSQYLVIIRVRPTPDQTSKIRQIATTTVEVEAHDKQVILDNPELVDQGKAEAMEAWLKKPGNDIHDQAYRDGLVQVETDPSLCLQYCEWIDGAYVCRQCPALSSSAGQAINGWAQSSEANIEASRSQASVEVVGRGQPRTTSLTGSLDFFLDRDSNVEIGGFDLWGHGITLSDGTNITDLTIGQNASITGVCADELPPGPFRLCERYLIPAGDEPGFEAGAAVKVDGNDLTVTLTNSQPIELLIDFNQMRYHMSGGPLEGRFDICGDDFDVRITLDISGDFTNLAPVPSAAETKLEWECVDDNKAMVKLSAEASVDELNPWDLVDYSWAEDAGRLTDTVLGTGKTLTVPMSFGEHDITLFVTDSHKITSQTSLVVKVVDSQIDHVEPPADRWELQQDRSGAPVWVGEAAASDNCSGMVDINNDAPASGWFPPGFSTVEWRFDDFRGNLVVHHQKIFVLEQQFFPAPMSDTQTSSDHIQFGQALQITHALVSQGKGMIADEYVIVYAPDGQEHSIDSSGHVVHGLLPRSTFTTFGAASTSTQVYSGVFSDELGDPGEYTVESSLVKPGGDPTDPADVIARSWSMFTLAP